MTEPIDFTSLDAYHQDFAAACMERFTTSSNELKADRRHDRMRRAWMKYYSRAEDSGVDETELNRAGERGEITLLKPNRWRRIVGDQVNQVAQQPGNPEPLALNTNPDSQTQVRLAKAIIKWYRTTAHVDSLKVDAARMAAVLLSAHWHVRWDLEEGPERGADNKGQAYYEGDFVFSIRSDYDCAYDKDSPNPREPGWTIVREPVNRFDLAHKYGQDTDKGRSIRNAIMDAPKWSSQRQEWQYERQEHEHDDSIPVYFVYIPKSRRNPQGRRALVLDDRTVLEDGPLPPEGVGVFRLSPEDVIFKAEGHSTAVDGLPIDAAYGGQISTIASNHRTHGGQTILTPKSGGVKHYELAAGFNALDWDDWDKKNNRQVPPPQVMNKLHTPPEMFTFGQVLKAELDDVMGGSPVQRGDPEATKGDSGSKAAMLFAAAQSVGNAYVQQCNNVMARVFSFMIEALKHHASLPRLIAILGDSQEFVAYRFVGQDLRDIRQVLIKDVNPSRDTFQGRMGVLEIIGDKPPEEQQRILGFLETGNLDAVTEDQERARMLLVWENEQLRDAEGQPPQVQPQDLHQQHYQKHSQLKNDPAVRQNPQLLARIDAHCAAHIAALTPGHPGFAGNEALMLTGQRPLPVPGAAPPGAPPPGARPPGPPGPPGKPPAGPPGPKPPVPGAEGRDQAAGGRPRMPQQPKNPTTGERVQLPVPDAPNV
jgi:hypothetical protein